MQAFPEAVMGHAREWAGRKLYEFSELERTVLRLFFTNCDQSVFLMHVLPQAVGDVLFAMYSRMKNARGVRGTFVDGFLPQFLATRLPIVEHDFGGNAEKFLKANRADSLGAFVSLSSDARNAFEEFLQAFSVNPDYIKRFGAAERVKKLLDTFLDKFGHNSIARMAGGIWIGFEQISILAAKSIEWGRPGAGYIERSTRYVDMSGKDCYPIAAELAAYGLPKSIVEEALDRTFNAYRAHSGDNFDGPFPNFLRDTYGHLYVDAPGNLEVAVAGEVCDVLGNFLPAATLTSVGACVSGEALPELIKHLRLDQTPENYALAEALISEGEKLGLQQFLGHLDISPWKEMCWRYLNLREFSDYPGRMTPIALPPRKTVEESLVRAFNDIERSARSMEGLCRLLRATPRGEFDKLPNQFEHHSAAFSGVMSFRGWRDLQRMGFCTHHRTLLTPRIGFYRYDKPAPPSLWVNGRDAFLRERDLYSLMASSGIPGELMQYPFVLGNLIGFQIGANLAEWEFCGFQRTAYPVDHEVRQVFCAAERELRQAYDPWWRELSRADMTPAYIFARGNKAISLAQVAVA
jgi:thymidylate synthase ThyX